jgi:hypothetical protein
MPYSPWIEDQFEVLREILQDFYLKIADANRDSWQPTRSIQHRRDVPRPRFGNIPGVDREDREGGLDEF